MTRLTRFVALVLLGLWLGLSLQSTAWAHEGSLIKSAPGLNETLQDSPKEIVLQFSEELDTKGSSVELVDAAGAVLAKGSVDLNDVERATLRASVPKVLDKGLYTIRYRAVLLDGDATEKQFSFGVGVAVPTGVISQTVRPVESVQQTTPRIPVAWVVPGVTVLVMILFVLGAILVRRLRRA